MSSIIMRYLYICIVFQRIHFVTNAKPAYKIGQVTDPQDSGL